MVSKVTRLRRDTKSTWRKRVDAWLGDLEEKNFFGQALLIFENGQPVSFKEVRTMKEEDLPASD